MADVISIDYVKAGQKKNLEEAKLLDERYVGLGKVEDRHAYMNLMHNARNKMNISVLRLEGAKRIDCRNIPVVVYSANEYNISAALLIEDAREVLKKAGAA